MCSFANPQLISNLEKLGLTENEAKTYAGLVSMKEATARQVHELTNVPRAKVYDILRALSKKGYVEIRQGSPAYYRAVEPKHIIGRIKDEMINCAIDTLSQLNELSYQVPTYSSVWCIESEWGIKNRVFELLGNTKEELIIYSTNPKFLREFEAELKKLEKRCRLIFVVDERDKFKEMPFEFQEIGKEFGDFIRELAIDEVRYHEDCLMISDGKESIAIHTLGEEKEAVVIRLPVICHLQKLIYSWLVKSGFILDS